MTLDINANQATNLTKLGINLLYDGLVKRIYSAIRLQAADGFSSITIPYPDRVGHLVRQLLVKKLQNEGYEVWNRKSLNTYSRIYGVDSHNDSDEASKELTWNLKIAW